MSAPAPVPFPAENKLRELNKKIAEIKKKIHLSEGQRKANFEEFETRKRENAERIAGLKRNVRDLYTEYGKTKNNDDRAEQQQRRRRRPPPVHMAREQSSASGKKCNLSETITKLEEGNMRIRKRLDLIKYQREKLRQRRDLLLRERNLLKSGKTETDVKKKMEAPARNKIVKLEVRLEHVRTMQIKANIMRMRYRSMRADLKEKSVFYASSLKELENDMREQENEMKRLQGVKEEAIELRGNTQETLIKEEIEVSTSGKERDATLQDYRQRVLERKMELEQLERMIFQPRTRDDFDRRGKFRVQPAEDITKDEVTRLEEAFAKLRSATGVSRSEDVLNRFLGQRATKDNLQKMRASAEQEKVELEKRRQRLINEMEMRKFSETKDSEQNAEEVARYDNSIEEQRSRQHRAQAQTERAKDLLQKITLVLWRLSDKFPETETEDAVPKDQETVDDPLDLLTMVNDVVTRTMDNLDGPDAYLDVVNETLTDKLETLSVATTSVEGKTNRANGGRLFPRFPASTTPAPLFSDEEEEVPTRNLLKRQAQQMVDTKSRRKGFSLKR